MIFKSFVLDTREQQLIYPVSADISERYRALFVRYLRSYNNVNIIAALLAGIDIGMLQLAEYHTASLSSLIQISLTFIASSAACATMSLMSATQLSLRYNKFNQTSIASTSDPHQPIAGYQLLFVSIPSILLEWSVLAFLVGLLLWYAALPGRSIVGFWLVTGHVFVLWLFYMFTRGEQRGTSKREYEIHNFQDFRKLVMSVAERDRQDLQDFWLLLTGFWEKVLKSFRHGSDGLPPAN